jgi:hypothetical protein
MGHVVFTEPENAKAHLEREFFRVFQCFPAISGEGLIGVKFFTPPLPQSSAATLLEAGDILEVIGWRRRFDQHLNKFTYLGNFNTLTNEFDSTLYDTETSEDSQNQTDTEETIEHLVESRWLNSTYDGVNIASQLASRARIRYLATPAEVELSAGFKKRNLDRGEVVAVTHRHLPNLLVGTRGLNARLMTATSIQWEYDEGTLRLRLLDTGYKRFGVIAPTGTTDYGAASDLEKGSFCFIGDNVTNAVGAGDTGYRVI